MATKTILYRGYTIVIDREKDDDGDWATHFEAFDASGLQVGDGHYELKLPDNAIRREFDIVLEDRAEHPEGYESGVSFPEDK